MADSPKVTLHARALIKDVRFGKREWLGYVRPEADPAAAVSFLFDVEDNSSPGRETEIVAGQGDSMKAPGVPPADRIAAALAFQYLHELGEHAQIEGLNLNQHERDGMENIYRITRDYVLPWMADCLRERGGTP
jgi:hypothetical protein